MEGRQIGRYRISRELGRGAMGIVYAALDPVIGRTVAIKTIHLAGLKESTSAGELRDRLRREAQAAGILNHPGIITIHDIGDEGEEAFIVMEYVDGQTLEEVFASGIPQHTTVLLGVLKKSAEALDFAHARGIVHRDIKPSNIMVARDGSVKVADFGVAKFSASTSMTQTGFVLGTPNYMSPEQAQARKLDGRSDQFALAVLAYRVLTGKLPFNAPTLTAVLTKLLWEQPEFSDTDLHPQVRAVLAKALSKDPAQRYATCAEFVGRLEKAYMSCRPEVPAYEDPLSPVTEETEPGDQTFLMRASPPDSSLETHALPAPTDGGNATASNFSLAGLGNEDETSTSFTGPPTEAAPGSAACGSAACGSAACPGGIACAQLARAFRGHDRHCRVGDGRGCRCASRIYVCVAEARPAPGTGGRHAGCPPCPCPCPRPRPRRRTLPSPRCRNLSRQKRRRRQRRSSPRPFPRRRPRRLQREPGNQPKPLPSCLLRRRPRRRPRLKRPLP